MTGLARLVFHIPYSAQKLWLWSTPGPLFLSDSTEKSVKFLDYQDKKTQTLRAVYVYSDERRESMYILT